MKRTAQRCMSIMVTSGLAGDAPRVCIFSAKFTQSQIYFEHFYYSQKQQINSNTHVGLCNTVKILKTTQYIKLLRDYITLYNFTNFYTIFGKDTFLIIYKCDVLKHTS